MKINREEFLKSLQLVKAGLSPREFIEQSSCFAFAGGDVFTFNDEVACRTSIGIELTGAVQAGSLLKILEKLTDSHLKIRENEDGELEFRGKSKGFAVTKDAEVFLPIDRVEKPEKWRKMPKGFMDAIDLVKHCVSADESRFMLTCVHIAPTYVEACDNLQIMRCDVDTGLHKSVLVRGTSIKDLVGLGVTGISQTESWIHFRNNAGLTFSCRQYAEKYPPLDELITFKGHPVTLPKAVMEATDRAAVFAMDRAGDPLVAVRLTDGLIRITGEGLTGWYKEERKVDYSGPRLEFLIAPDLLKHICENYSSARIADEKLKATGKQDGRPWVYVTVLGAPGLQERKDPKDVEQEEEEPTGEE